MIASLVVDDHPVLREGLMQILANEQGITVAGEASSGAEALRKAREHDYREADPAEAGNGQYGMGDPPRDRTWHLIPRRDHQTSWICATCGQVVARLYLMCLIAPRSSRTPATAVGQIPTEAIPGTLWTTFA